MEMTKRILVLLVAIVMVSSGMSSAAILNGDFESGSFNLADNWTELPGDSAQVFYHASADQVNFPNPTGTYNSGRVLFIQQINGIGAQQVLSSVEDSYEFSFAAGYRNESITNGDITLVVSVVDQTGATLDSESITITDPGVVSGGLSNPAWGSFAPYTVNFDIDTNGVTETALRFTNPGDNQWLATAMIDNVVPEPMTMLLLGFGGLSILRRRR